MKKRWWTATLNFGEFIKTMAILGPKLGPMLFQFPFFDRWKFPKQDNFLAMLAPFLKETTGGIGSL